MCWNWVLEPEKVKRLVLVEPDRYMLAKLEAKKSRFNLPLETMLAEAEKLPFPDNSFDYVITTLVLCTVRDLDKSLAEILRVLKPGGELRFFEHVRSKSGIFSAAQTMMTPVWKRCSLGCHLNRDTFAAIKRAGFHFCDFEDSGYNLATLLPLIDGYAQKAGV
jgi:ubiquinone/menaquinone biosynthesis C-methylase UbiE